MGKIGRFIITGPDAGALMTINCDKCLEVKVFQGDLTHEEVIKMVEARGWKVTGSHTVCDTCRAKKQAENWGTH
jgi:hypothetical protein